MAIPPGKEDTVFFQGPPDWYERSSDNFSSVIVPPASKDVMENVAIGEKHVCKQVPELSSMNVT